MANRAVVVDLLVRTGQFTAGMRRASHDMASETTNMETKTKALQMQIGLLGVGMTAFAAIAVKKWADFDQAMARVEATGGEAAKRIGELNEAAKSDEVIALGYSATEASDSIYELVKAGVSAADIIGGGMAGALALAAAETMDAGDAAQIMASALTQFNLEGRDSAHVADLVTAGAGKAQGSAHDLGLALKQSGLVANQFGLSIEETTGTLAFFASAGLIGSDAGTSLRTMLLHLAGPSTKAANLMEEIGLEVYKSNGQMVGMDELANNLQSSLGKLTEEQKNQALATIFGADATRAASLLYREGGDKVVEWTEKVNDAGYAQEVARKRMDNLNGDIKKLSTTWERSLINMGSSADAPLRKLVQGVTGLIDQFGELPPEIQGVIMALTGGGGLAILGVLGIAQVTSALSTLQAGLVATGVISEATATRMARGFGLVTKALGIVGVAAGVAVGVFQLVKSAQNDLSVSTDDLAASYDAAANKFTEASKALVADKIFKDLSWLTKYRTSFDSMGDAAEHLGVDLGDLTDAMLGNKDAHDRVTESVEAHKQAISNIGGQEGLIALNDYEDALGIINEGISDNVKVSDEARDKAERLAEAQTSTTGTTTELAGETGVLAEGLAGATEATEAITAAEVAAQKAHDEYISSLVDSFTSFFDLGDTYQNVIDKQRELAESAAEETQSTKDSWQDFYDGTTVTFATYRAELEAQVVAQETWAGNMLALTGRMQTEMPAQLRIAAQEMIAELRSLGPEGAAQVAMLQSLTAAELQAVVDLFNRQGAAAGADWAAGVDEAENPKVEVETEEAVEEVRYLEDLIKEMPDGKAKIDVDTSVALSKVQAVKTAIATLNGTKVYGPPTPSAIPSTAPNPFVGPRRAHGGDITGPGTGTSDSILSLLSNGEHVLTASDVQKAGGQDAIYRMRGAIQAGALRFAEGGAVSGAQVNAWYLRYLGRGAGPQEQAWWARQEPGGVEQGIRESVEGLTQEIRGWYQQYLGRPAADSEAASWAGAGISGSDIEWLIENSPEAQNFNKADALRGAREDVAPSIERGETLDNLTSDMNGVFGVTDKARKYLELLEGATRDGLAAAITQAEASAKGLFAQLENVTSELDESTDKAAELQSLADDIQSSLVGGFRLGATGQAGTVNPFTGEITGGGGGAGRGLVAAAQAHASKVRAFAGKLQQLADRGFAGAILQEVAALGVDAGMASADALLTLDPTDTGALNQAYRDIATFGGQAGQAVTEGFYAGGAAAAQGIVAGLESQKTTVQAAITRMAVAMQDALKTALGIASPARKPRALMSFVGQGIALGLDDQRGIVADASARLGGAVMVGLGGGAYGGTGSGDAGRGDITATLTDEQIERLATAFETGNVRNINAATAKKNRQMHLTYGAKGR